MCSIFYPGEIFLENASCYRVIALHTRRSVCVLPNTVLPGNPARAHTRVHTRAKVEISCSTFSNADHGYTPWTNDGKIRLIFRVSDPQYAASALACRERPAQSSDHHCSPICSPLVQSPARRRCQYVEAVESCTSQMHRNARRSTALLNGARTGVDLLLCGADSSKAAINSVSEDGCGCFVIM